MTVDVSDIVKMPQDPAKAPRPERVPIPKTPPPAAAAALPARPGSLKCPPPGVYPGVAFDDYCRWNALNHTALRKVGKSLAHYHQAMSDPDDHDSSPKHFGRAGHTILLEPERFKTDLCRAAPPVNPTTERPFGRDTKKFADFAALHPGKLILLPEEMANILGCSQAVLKHPAAGPLIKLPGQAEVSIVWVCPITGLLCKGRIDRIVPDMGCRVDFKTTENASEDDFKQSIVKYGYVTQDPFYGIGAEALKMPEKRLLFVAAESSPPFGVAVYALGPNTYMAGRALVLEWLHKVKAAMEAGIWPAYSDAVQDIEAPAWWFNKFGLGDDIH